MPPARGRQRGRGRARAARGRGNPVNVNNQEQEAGRTRGARQRSRFPAPQPARPPRRRRRIAEVPDNEPPVLHRRTPESSSPSSSDDECGPQTPKPTVPPADEVHARLDHLNARLDSIIPLLGTQPPLQHSSLGTSQGLLTQTAGVPAAAAGAPTMDPVHQMIVQGATVQPGEQTKLLGTTIDPDLRDKIKAGKFIELPALKKSHYEIRESNTIKLNQPRSFGDWLELFLIYATIRSNAVPQEAPHLFTYIGRIRDLSLKETGTVWRDYDREFRQIKAVDHNLSYLKIDMDILYNILPPRSTQPIKPPSHTNTPRHPFPVSRGAPLPNTCLPFYYGGWCSNIRECRKRHICAHCSKIGHNYQNCYQLPQQPKSNPNTPK